LPLSLICLYCWRNVLACLFSIQTRVSDRSHLITLDATILFQGAGFRPEDDKDTPRVGVIRGICRIELSIRTVNKQRFIHVNIAPTTDLANNHNIIYNDGAG
jgi:hypothetical protein